MSNKDYKEFVSMDEEILTDKYVYSPGNATIWCKQWIIKKQSPGESIFIMCIILLLLLNQIFGVYIFISYIESLVLLVRKLCSPFFFSHLFFIRSPSSSICLQLGQILVHFRDVLTLQITLRLQGVIFRSHNRI